MKVNWFHYSNQKFFCSKATATTNLLWPMAKINILTIIFKSVISIKC